MISRIILEKKMNEEKNTSTHLDATGDPLGAGLALALVVGLIVIDAGALGEHVAVGDGGEVAEDILAAVVGGDESEAAVVPATSDTSLADATAPAAAASGGSAAGVGAGIVAARRAAAAA